MAAMTSCENALLRSHALSQLCDEWLKKPRVFLSNFHVHDSSLV